jgi:hypothetical protein
MTRRPHALLVTCTALALASLGAGPATQPIDIRQGSVEVMPKAAELKLDMRFLQKSLETIPSARVYVPRLPEAGIAMPRAGGYLTPRSEWIPRRFNGQTFYIIPCATAAASSASAPVAVNVCTIVTPANPAAVAPAQPKR